MTPEQTIKLVREMERYSYIEPRKRVRHKRGHLIRQALIPIATAAQDRMAFAVGEAARYARLSKAEWVPVNELISEQHRLTPRRLIYQLRRFDEMQTRKRPLVIPLRGGFFIWDGNHRCTAGIMLGKNRMRCDVLRPKRARLRKI